MSNLADLFKKYGAVVFFDTETTGLDATTCQIIELAAIRIEQTDHGSLRVADNYDVFIKLPEGQTIPEKITGLTGITDDMLAAEGIPEKQAADDFLHLIRKAEDGRPALLAAHNAQFDLLFALHMLARHGGTGELSSADYLDTLTVYKDRRAYPHKLANAITAYHLEDKVQNSHRAIDDVLALFEVCRAMDNEREDLYTYVNVFGYNPKYGVSGDRLQGVKYWPQNFNNYMQSPNYTLPARMWAAMKARKKP